MRPLARIGLAAVALTAALTPGLVRAQATNIDHIDAAQFQSRGQALLADATKSPDGLALAILQKSPNHYAELVARTRSGGAEVHAEYDDVFFFMDGEATEVVGGTVVDPRLTAPGETRGASVTGGARTHLGKGDVLQVAARTPHQMLVPAGKTVTYYVVKVQVPKQP